MRLFLGVFFFAFLGLALAPLLSTRGGLGLARAVCWKQFNERDRRIVSMSPADFDNTGVTAGAVLVARGKGIKDLPNHRLILNDSQRLTPGMEGPLLARRQALGIVQDE